MRFTATAVAWIMMTVLLVVDGRSQDVRALTGQSQSDGAGVVNWAAPEHGARYHAGPNTQFLGANDLRSLVAQEGDRAIFRHGPRSQEEVIIVELAAPVLVRCVAFGTSIGDTVRVPTGFEVYLSSSGKAGSYQFAGACTDVIAFRSMVVVEPATSAQWVKLAFHDSGGGSRVSWIGVFNDTPERVKVAIGGFDAPDWTQRYENVRVEMERLRQQYGGIAGFDLTFHCGSIEYSSPALVGEGSLLDRFLAEGGHVKRQLERVRQELPVYRAIGVTAMETYVRWNFVEEHPGQFDFSVYDAFLSQFRRHGIRWVPMLLAGPAYTLPDWYRASPDYTPLRCLEHDQNNAIASLWDPNLRPRIEAFIRAFARHYSPADLQSVMLGISGSYGENLYPGGEPGDWTTNTTGDYHSHFGWWAGDVYARSDFRRYLSARYGTVEALNAAWASTFQSFEEVHPVPPDRCQSRRARLDFMEWYVGSMTAYLEFWLQTARRYMPTARLLISTGGDGWPALGSDFPMVAKLAAEYRAGVRITNEGEDYLDNVARTRWISSACRFYGAWLGTEPASLQIQSPSIAYRVFNATTSGASELFCYPSGFWHRDAYAKLMESLPYLRTAKPVISLAYWVPKTHLMAQDDPADYVALMSALRKVTDFDAVDGTMIDDGALRKYRVLLMGNGRVEKAEVLRAIVQWVRDGGVLVRLGDGHLITVQGSTEYDRKLFGEGARGEPLERSLGKGRVVLIPLADQDASWQAACLAAARAAANGCGSRAHLVEIPEGIYASQLSTGTMLLNTRPESVPVRYEFPRVRGREAEGTVVVGAHAIGIIPPDER